MRGILPTLLACGLAFAGPALAGTVTSSAEWQALRADVEPGLVGADPVARVRAVQRLGAADWPDAVKVLLKVLALPDPRVDTLTEELEKAYRLYLLLEKSTKGRQLTNKEAQQASDFRDQMGTLRAALAAANGFKREVVAALARTRHEDAVPLVVKAAETGDPATRGHVLLALAAVPGEAAAEAIRRPLPADPSPFVRTAAVDALGRRATAADLPVLVAACADEAWPVRSAALAGLRALGDPAAVEPLLAMLRRETGRLRGDVAEVLAALTGHRADPDPDLWQSWWDAHKAEVLARPRTPKPGASADAGAKGGLGTEAPGAPAAPGDAPPPAAPADTPPPAAHGTEAGFYGVPTTSKRVAFVVDVSGSMKWRARTLPTGTPPVGPDGAPRKPLPEVPSKLDVVKGELVRAIGALADDATVAVVTYAFAPKLLGGAIGKATRATKQRLVTEVDALVAEGGTNIYDALDLVLGLGQNGRAPEKTFGDGVDTIFLMSDGAPSWGTLMEPEKIRDDILARVRTRQVKIHTIWVRTDEAEPDRRARDEGKGGDALMRALAEGTGGTYVER